jgi:beta-lactam-binding protein with PASTA domain
VPIIAGAPIQLASMTAPPRGAARIQLTGGAEVEAARTMPDLAGKTLRQALTALAARNVEVEIHGRGVVTGQAPRAGEFLAPGVVVHLELSPR